jgi:hypothetical protein
MLDIRTLLLVLPEDRYAPNPMLRQAEILIYPLVAKVRWTRGVRQAGRFEEVMN